MSKITWFWLSLRLDNHHHHHPRTRPDPKYSSKQLIDNRLKSEFCFYKSVFIQYNQFNSQVFTAECLEPGKVPEKVYPRRSSKTAFCVQLLRKGKLTPSTEPGPKYSSNRHNIALVHFIQDFLHRDKNKDKISGRKVFNKFLFFTK